jgi:hypothetical protein
VSRFDDSEEEEVVVEVEVEVEVAVESLAEARQEGLGRVVYCDNKGSKLSPQPPPAAVDAKASQEGFDVRLR